MNCNNELCLKNEKDLVGYGIRDYILLHGLEFEILLSFYVASAFEGRGFFNSPISIEEIIMSEEEEKRIMKDNDIPAIQKYIKTVIPSEYAEKPENHKDEVNACMAEIIKTVPEIDLLKVLYIIVQEWAIKGIIKKELRKIKPLSFKVINWIAYNTKIKLLFVPPDKRWEGCRAGIIISNRLCIFNKKWKRKT